MAPVGYSVALTLSRIAGGLFLVVDAWLLLLVATAGGRSWAIGSSMAGTTSRGSSHQDDAGRFDRHIAWHKRGAP